MTDQTKLIEATKIIERLNLIRPILGASRQYLVEHIRTDENEAQVKDIFYILGLIVNKADEAQIKLDKLINEVEE